MKSRDLILAVLGLIAGALYWGFLLHSHGGTMFGDMLLIAMIIIVLVSLIGVLVIVLTKK